MTQAFGPREQHGIVWGARRRAQRKGRVIEDDRTFKRQRRRADGAARIRDRAGCGHACRPAPRCRPAKQPNREPSAAATVASTGQAGRNACAGGTEAGRGRSRSCRGDAANAARRSAPVCRDREGREGRPGPFPVWQKDDRRGSKLRPSMLDKPFFLSINMSRGIGERGAVCRADGQLRWYATGGEYVVEFRKAGGNIQLIARNTTFVARPGSPEERAVRKRSRTACWRRRRSRARRTRSASRC